MAWPVDGPVSLGIDWFYYPVVRYYLERHDGAAVSVDVLPSRATHDYVYVRRGHESDAWQAIAIYPQSGSVLARPR